MRTFPSYVLAFGVLFLLLADFALNAAQPQAQTQKSAPKTADSAYKALPENEIAPIPDNQISTGLKADLEYCGFSPDGKKLVVVDGKGGVIVLDSSTWKSLKNFTVPEPFKANLPVPVAVSPDFKWLVFGCRDNSAHVWNLETEKEVHRLKGHTDFVRFMAFSPDSKKLVTGTNDPTLFVWDLVKGDLIKKFARGTGLTDEIAFTPDGKELIVPSFNAIQRLNPLTGAELGKQKIPNFSKALAVSPDGKLIAHDVTQTGKQFDVSLWDRKAGTTRTVPGFKMYITKVAFVSNKILAVQGYNVAFKDQMNLWDLESKKQLSRFELRNKFAISPDGKTLVTRIGTIDPELKLNVIDLTALVKAK